MCKWSLVMLSMHSRHATIFLINNQKLIWSFVALNQNYFVFDCFCFPLLSLCSQMWPRLSQRRSVYGAQQVPVQERLLRRPVWEEWAGYAQRPGERRHTGPHHWHDLVPPRPDQLYRIGVRRGRLLPAVILKLTQIYLPPPADSKRGVLNMAS